MNAMEGLKQNPSRLLAERAAEKMQELGLSYNEAAEYVLMTNPGLAKRYQEFTLEGPPPPPDCPIDHHLSRAANNYRPAGFIADRIFPTAPCREEDGEMYHAMADVTLEGRGSANPCFIQQFEEGRTHRTLDSLYLDWEQRMGRMLLAPESRIPVRTPFYPWSIYAEDTPLDDIYEAMAEVENATGKEANRILFSGTAWRHFRRNQKVIDKATNPHVSGGGLYPSTHQIEALLGLQVLVGNAWYNAAEEAMPLNLTQVWGAGVLVYRAAERSNIQEPSLGWNLRWTPPGMSGPWVVKRMPYDTRRHLSEILVACRGGEMLSKPALGCLIPNVVEAP